MSRKGCGFESHLRHQTRDKVGFGLVFRRGRDGKPVICGHAAPLPRRGGGGGGGGGFCGGVFFLEGRSLDLAASSSNEASFSHARMGSSQTVAFASSCKILSCNDLLSDISAGLLFKKVTR